MHRDTMLQNQNGCTNILSPSFDEFGMGTATDKKGRLYMVQLFCKSDTKAKLTESVQVAGWTWCGTKESKQI